MASSKQLSVQPHFKGKSQTVAWKAFLVIPKHYQRLALFLFKKSEYIPSVSVRTVMTGAGVADQIRATFGWRDAMLSKALKTLVSCGFMRKIQSERGNYRRGFYEINPIFTEQNIKQISDIVSDSYYDVMFWPDSIFDEKIGQMVTAQIAMDDLLQGENNTTEQQKQDDTNINFDPYEQK